MSGKYICKEGEKEMKKIIEIGKIFKARCPKCNCLFQYEKEDIQIKKLGGDEYSIITCPQCDKEISTRGRLDIAIDDSHLSKEERFLRGDFFKTL